MNVGPWRIRHCGLDRAVSARPRGEVVAACQTLQLRADVRSLLAPPPTPLAWTLVPNLSAVVFWWQNGARQGATGGKRGVSTRACTEYVRTYLSLSVRISAQPPLIAQRATHCVQQTSKTAIVCGVGGGAPALAGEGVVKELCVRMQARRRPAMCHACISEAVRAPFPPFPGVRQARFLFEPALGRARLPCCLSLCLPLYLTLIHLALTRWRQRTPYKASASQ